MCTVGKEVASSFGLYRHSYQKNYRGPGLHDKRQGRKLGLDRVEDDANPLSFVRSAVVTIAFQEGEVRLLDVFNDARDDRRANLAFYRFQLVSEVRELEGGYVSPLRSLQVLCVERIEIHLDFKPSFERSAKERGRTVENGSCRSFTRHGS